jgi:hypothetical protein
MGNSYMGWKKKGKGFLMGEGMRDEGIRGLRKSWVQSFLHDLTPRPLSFCL